MAKIDHLYLRNGVYQFRRRLPDLIAKTTGRSHIQKSLKTRDKKEAMARRNRLIVALEAEWAAIDGARDASTQPARRLEEMSIVEIDAMVRRWFDSEFGHVVKEAHHRLSDPNWTSFEHADRLDELGVEQGRLLAPEFGRDQDISHAAELLLLNEGFRQRSEPAGVIQAKSPRPAVDHSSVQFQHLMARMVDALREIARAEIKALSGEEPTVSSANLANAGARVNGKPTTTLRDLIEKFENDPSRRRVSSKTVASYAMTFRALKAFLGEQTLAHEITREQSRRFQAFVRTLPANAIKLYPRKPLLDIPALAKQHNKPLISDRTVNTYLYKSSTLFDWAKREGYVDTNHFEGLSIEIAKRLDREARDPFTAKELQKIFNAPLYRGCVGDDRGWSRPGPNRPKGTRYWVPLLSLYHGMRLNEICQLYCADIRKIDGVWCIDVHDDRADQKIKNESARRTVPVHPKVIELGFLNFHRERAKGDARLFADILPGPHGHYSDRFQKWFHKFRHSVGLKSSKTTFHSFRHTWRDRVRSTDIPQEIADALGGWKDPRASAAYGKGFPAERLLAELSKVSYDDLDIEHLI